MDDKTLGKSAPPPLKNRTSFWQSSFWRNCTSWMRVWGVLLCVCYIFVNLLLHDIFSHKEKTWLPFSCVWLSSFTVVRLNNTSVAETFLLPVEVKNSSHQSLEDCAFVIVFIPFHHRLQIKSNVTITSINNTRSSSPNSTTHNTAISLTKRHSSITDSLIPYSSHNHANPLRVSFPSLSNA